MESKYNESTPQRPEGARVVDDKVVSIDLPTFMNRLKVERTWADSDRNAITVFKTNGFRVVLVGLHKAAEMPRKAEIFMASSQQVSGNQGVGWQMGAG